MLHGKKKAYLTPNVIIHVAQTSTKISLYFHVKQLNQFKGYLLHFREFIESTFGIF